MSIVRGWIQLLTCAVDSITGALHVQQGGLANADRAELTPALPNTGTDKFDFGAVCHEVVLTVPVGASCRYSFKGPATSDSIPLDGTMIKRLHFPEGVSCIWVYTGSNMSAYELSSEGC